MRLFRRHHRLLLVAATAAFVTVVGNGCAHDESAESKAAEERGGQERVVGPGFSVERPAGFRTAEEEDRADPRVARVLDAGGLAFLAQDPASDATAFVLPGGTPFPEAPTEAFCEQMASAFVRRGNTEELSLTLDSTLGEGGCAIGFVSTRDDGVKRRHRGLFFAARGQTWQLQTTANANNDDVNEQSALEVLIASWTFEPLPPVKTATFTAPVPKGFHEAADPPAKETRQRGGVMWVAAKAPVAGIIVPSIAISPAVGVTSPLTEASCREAMAPLTKTMRGVDIVAANVRGQATCRARGSDAAAPERQLSTTLVPVGQSAVWVLCRYHVVDDDAAAACERVPETLSPPSGDQTSASR